MRDLISRQAAIDAVESMLRRKFGIGGDLAEITLAGLPSAQPATNCSEFPNNSDTISRQAATDTLRGYLVGKRCPDDGTLTCRLIENEVINKLPPAQLATDTNVGTKLGIDPHKIERAIRGLTEWQKHVQTESDIDRDISVAVEALKAQVGTDLAQLGTDCISRQQAVDALRKMQTYKLFSGDDMLLIDQAGAQTELMLLPFAQPEIIYCKDCKKQNKHYHESPYKDTVCPLTAWRGKAQGHEYDYQYCCYADRREVTT